MWTYENRCIFDCPKKEQSIIGSIFGFSVFDNNGRRSFHTKDEIHNKKKGYFVLVSFIRSFPVVGQNTKHKIQNPILNFVFCHGRTKQGSQDEIVVFCLTTAGEPWQNTKYKSRKCSVLCSVFCSTTGNDPMVTDLNYKIKKSVFPGPHRHSMTEKRSQSSATK